jgi:hypothetical protein
MKTSLIRRKLWTTAAFTAVAVAIWGMTVPTHPPTRANTKQAFEQHLNRLLAAARTIPVPAAVLSVPAQHLTPAAPRLVWAPEAPNAPTGAVELAPEYGLPQQFRFTDFLVGNQEIIAGALASNPTEGVLINAGTDTVWTYTHTGYLTITAFDSMANANTLTVVSQTGQIGTFQWTTGQMQWGPTTS